MPSQGLAIRYNPMRLTSLHAFCSMRGGYTPPCRDVYFVRWEGCPDTPAALEREAAALLAQAGSAGVLCTAALDRQLPPDCAARFVPMYRALAQGVTPDPLPFAFADPLLTQTFAAMFPDLLTHYRRSRPDATETIVQNCGVRLLYWFSHDLPALFPQGRLTAAPVKVLFVGEPSAAEYLFLYGLTRLGCDVAVVCPAGAPALPPALCALSACQPGTPVPGYRFTPPAVPIQSPAARTPRPAASCLPAETAPPPARASVRIPPRPGRRTAAPLPAVPAPSDTPLSYEALAARAASVVMIEALDETGDCHSTGSGVLIAPGIVLTNFHVVQGGCAFRVLLENDPTPHQTDELLKYHPPYDLALLRVDCGGQPIPLYAGELARGQEVVAIGSPLGLFNSVSDGIISGFRQIDEKSMIQFTAPTSPGSSGGALLNRCGALIGLITGAFREGQNLNLAVDHRTIAPFIQGFVPATRRETP